MPRNQSENYSDVPKFQSSVETKTPSKQKPFSLLMLAAVAPVYELAAVSMEVKPETASYASGLRQGGREWGCGLS